MLSERNGFPCVSKYPAYARLNLVRCVLLLTFRLELRVEKKHSRPFRWYVRRGALEVAGGQLDFCCDVLGLQKQGVDTPLEVNRMGHLVLSVVAFGGGRSRSGRGPKFSAPFLNGPLWMDAQTFLTAICIYSLLRMGCTALKLLRSFRPAELLLLGMPGMDVSLTPRRFLRNRMSI